MTTLRMLGGNGDGAADASHGNGGEYAAQEAEEEQELENKEEDAAN